MALTVTYCYYRKETISFSAYALLTGAAIPIFNVLKDSKNYLHISCLIHLVFLKFIE
jgi:hypothetical protein